MLTYSPQIAVDFITGFLEIRGIPTGLFISDKGEIRDLARFNTLMRLAEEYQIADDSKEKILAAIEKHDLRGQELMDGWNQELEKRLAAAQTRIDTLTVEFAAEFTRAFGRAP